MTEQQKQRPTAWHERGLNRAALFFVFLAAIFAIIGEFGRPTVILLGIAAVLAVLQIAIVSVKGEDG